jgi:hypothetical protein
MAFEDLLGSLIVREQKVKAYRQLVYDLLCYEINSDIKRRKLL